ncbi:MAG: hypothetical protein FK732_08345 [Asgard group archaeon]|nr:hypothetical protein [Asgard group archaeon]
MTENERLFFICYYIHKVLLNENALTTIKLVIFLKNLTKPRKKEGKKMRDNQHTWFIVSGITGILFIIWGSIATDARPLIPGDQYLVIPGCMLVIIGITGILEGFIVDLRIKKYFSGLETNTLTLLQVADDLSMDADFLQKRIIALKLDGKLAISFDQSTGVIVKSDLLNAKTCKFCAYPNVTKKFCPVCGTKKIVEKAK